MNEKNQFPFILMRTLFTYKTYPISIINEQQEIEYMGTLAGEKDR